MNIKLPYILRLYLYICIRFDLERRKSKELNNCREIIRVDSLYDMDDICKVLIYQRFY